MSRSEALIPPTANPTLEAALKDKVRRIHSVAGSLGPIEPLAVRLGLIRNTLKPNLGKLHSMLFAADHGLAVDDGGPERRSTVPTVQAILDGRLPLATFARVHEVELTVVDCGVAEPIGPHPRLLERKIAHGTRNVRTSAAMSIDQAHAALRAGLEIGSEAGIDAISCAGIGVGSARSAALLLSHLENRPLRTFLDSDRRMAPGRLEHLLHVLGRAQERHRGIADPVEALAAFGGFEMAVMAGVMLASASRRRLIVVDGIAASAALSVARRIAPAVPDYCLHVRSNRNHGLDGALALFDASALFPMDLDSLDGTGAVLAWPSVKAAAAMLTEVTPAANPQAA